MSIWTWFTGSRRKQASAADATRARARRRMAEAFEAYEDAQIALEEADRRAPRRRQAAKAPAGSKPLGFGSVKVFSDAALALDPDERVSLRAVFDRYVAWCKETRLPPAEVERFADEFEKVCNERGCPIRPADGAAYCFGMRFAA